MPSSHILLVDDDQDSCDLISFMLQQSSRDYLVTSVSTANEAIALIGARSFDLYVLDYALPETTGVELCRMIREKNQNTSILFYTAMSRPIDREQAFSAGADEFLIKPNDLENLENTVNSLLSKRSLNCGSNNVSKLSNSHVNLY